MFCEDKYIFLSNISTEKFTSIEEDIVLVFNERKVLKASFPDLYSWLIEKGHKEDYIKKTCFNSSLLYVDKSFGKQHYSYHFILEYQSNNRIVSVDLTSLSKI